jgi:hypothetical protein
MPNLIQCKVCGEQGVPEVISKGKLWGILSIVSAIMAIIPFPIQSSLDPDYYNNSVFGGIITVWLIAAFFLVPFCIVSIIFYFVKRNDYEWRCPSCKSKNIEQQKAR